MAIWVGMYLQSIIFLTPNGWDFVLLLLPWVVRLIIFGVHFFPFDA
jgi:hypothetical protein